MATVFEKELIKEFKQMISDAEGAITSAVETGFMNIVQSSPSFSGFYRRNHKIRVDQRTSSTDPTSKPSNAKRGSLEEHTGDTTNREIDNMAGFKLGKEINIFNPVKYTKAIEFGGKGKKGRYIYVLAKKSISSDMQSRFGKKIITRTRKQGMKQFSDFMLATISVEGLFADRKAAKIELDRRDTMRRGSNRQGT